MSRSILREAEGTETVEWGLMAGLLICGLLLLIIIAPFVWLTQQIESLPAETNTTIQGVQTAAYAAPNLAESKAFYTRVLGFDPYIDEPTYVGFNVGGYELALDPLAGVGGGVVVYWGVEDIEAEYVRLLRLGARPHKPIANVGGDLRVAIVLDPAGNHFGIIYNPAFELP